MGQHGSPLQFLHTPCSASRGWGPRGWLKLSQTATSQILVWRPSLSDGLLFSRRTCTPGLLRPQTHPVVAFSLGAGLVTVQPLLAYLLQNLLGRS